MKRQTTEITVFGVAHHDETIPDKIEGKSPDTVHYVYHESVERTSDNVVDSILWRPLQFLRLLIKHVAAKTDISPRGTRTECEKAALALADRHDAEFHHIGMLRKDRAAGVRWLSTVTEWMSLFAFVAIVFAKDAIFPNIGTLTLAVAIVFGFVFLEKLWSRVEHPIREYHMANGVLNHPPGNDEVGVVIVGADHSEPVEAKLEAFETDSEDLTN